LRSSTKGYGGKNHYTASKNSDINAHSGRKMYNSQFLLQAASPETFGYTLVYISIFFIFLNLPTSEVQERCARTLSLFSLYTRQWSSD